MPAKIAQPMNSPAPTPLDADLPLLSIVIVVFHDRDELASILESIVPFLSSQLEIVVVDGGSSDGTVDLLETHRPPVHFWCSEPDRGIYDAMNKGVSAARGAYILHLNAGDRLLAVPWDALCRGRAETIDVICCRVLLDNDIEFISRTGLLSRIDNTWHHQGTFYRRSAHLGYDISYRTHADFEHNQRLLLRRCSILQDHTLVALHRGNGVTAPGTERTETYRSIRANYGPAYVLLARFRVALLNFRQALRLLGKKPE